MKRISVVSSIVSIPLVHIGNVYAQGTSPVAAATINIAAPPNLFITDVGKLVTGTIGAVLVIASIAAFGYLIWGGIQWVTSGGDKSAVEAAQHRIQAALLGLFIVFASWAIMSIVGNFFGFSLLNLTLPRPF